ncbi:MAG: alpha/beta hydrolase [Planctomycetes bacterium]|nr:alpha/beta hydrolase [Planctomycetota bacterium]
MLICKRGFWIICVLVCFVCGCGRQYSIKTSSPVAVFRKQLVSALNSGEISEESRQFLRLEYLDKDYEKDPAGMIAILYDKARQSGDMMTRFAAAELSLLEGRRVFDKDQHKAVGFYLQAAELAYDYLFGTEAANKQQYLKPSYRFMELVYNRAVSRAAVIGQLRQNGWSETKGYQSVHTTYEISPVKEGDVVWNPEHFDKLLASNRIEVKGLRNKYFVKGIGGSLVGISENLEGHPLFDDYSNKDMVAHPVTAILEFDDAVEVGGVWKRKGTMTFYNPLLTDSVTLGGREVPLEADYSTSLGVLLSGLKAKDSDVWEVFAAKDEIEDAGIYMLEPFRHDQIPVVMVHGLMSYPATWSQMFNDLRGDAELRKKYQFWFYLYPTGLPLLYSASLLRDELNGIRGKYDSAGTNPNFNKMVVIGHSMGGLLTRFLIADSGELFWGGTFNKPPSELGVSDENREFIKNILIFDKLDYVNKVIFLATPHGGSKDADSFIAKLASSFISFPDRIEEFRRDLRAEDMTEQSKEILDSVPNGVMQLSPSAPDIEELAKLGIDAGVIYHSIIATGKSDYGPGSNDGLVDYESSHLDGAASEKLVKSGHGVHRHPLAIAEVKRILREYSRETK